MCEVYDFISDIETIALSSRGDRYTMSISFPFPIENSSVDLPLALMIPIAGFLNYMAVQWDLGCSFPNAAFISSWS
jgi:hypothetical protein